MALIKMGALAQDVRGSLNGSTFSRNRGGAYIRAKVSPIQPVSLWSKAARQAFKANSQAWATSLTAAQRAAWIAFAAVHPWINVFGDSIILSGVAMYQAVNQRLQLVGQPVLASPPASFVVADLGSVTVAATIVAGQFTALSIVPGRALAYLEGLYVLLTPGLPAGRKVQRTNYRLINTAASGLFWSAENISTFANGRFTGTPWTTGKQWSMLIAAMNWSTGAIGMPMVYTATI